MHHVWSPAYIDAPLMRLWDIFDTEKKAYFTHDGNFNVTALVAGWGDDVGKVLERYVYDAYGQVTVLDGEISGNGDWELDTDNISDWDNELLFCGYRLDGDTGLYHVRNRDYHAPLGRWLQRDPIGYGGGTSLYEYGIKGPLQGTDPYGLLWDWVPSGGRRTNAVAGLEPQQSTWVSRNSRWWEDTIQKLAWRIALEPSEFHKWAVLPGGSILTYSGKKVLSQLDINDMICPGEKVSVPNLILMIYGDSFGLLGTRTGMVDDWHRVLDEMQTWLRDEGFFVLTWKYDKTSEPRVQGMLGSKDLYGLFYAGHGGGGGILKPLKDDTANLAPNQYVNHRLAFMVLLACESAVPDVPPDQQKSVFNPNTTGGRTDVSSWETNVSSGGEFMGVLNSPSKLALPPLTWPPHYVFHTGGARFTWESFPNTSAPSGGGSW